ncbi:VOC family protein [Verrucomicrobiales bacterium]|nr:VOC family protein [Verrucomicrobiales bacterium]
MKPCGLRIWTNRLAESRAFYTEILPFKVNFGGSDQGWIIIGTPSIDLILESDEGAESSRYTGLSFWVDDIQTTYRDLSEKGVEFVSPPQKQEWGGWLADFRDCTGNTLTLVQNPD